MTASALLDHADTLLPVLKSNLHKGTNKKLDPTYQSQNRHHLWAWTATGAFTEEGAKKPNALAGAQTGRIINQTGAPSVFLNVPKTLSPYLATKPDGRSSPSAYRKATSRHSKLPSVDAANHDNDRQRREQGNALTCKLPKADLLHSLAHVRSSAASTALPRVYMSQAKTGTSPMHRRSTGMFSGEDSRAASKRPPWQSLSGSGEGLWGASRAAAAGHVPIAFASRVLVTKSNPVMRTSKTPSLFGEAPGAKRQAAPAAPARPTSTRHADSSPMASHGSAPGDLEQQLASAAAPQNPKVNQGGDRLPMLPRPQELLASWLTPPDLEHDEEEVPSRAGPAAPAAQHPAVRSPLFNRRLSNPSSPSRAAADPDNSPPTVSYSFKRVRSAEGPSAVSGDEELPGNRFLGRALAFKRRAEPEEDEDVRQGAGGRQNSTPYEEEQSSSSEDEELPGNRFLGRALAFKRRAEPEEVEDVRQGAGGQKSSALCEEEQSSSSEDEELPSNRFLGRALAFKRRAEPEEGEEGLTRSASLGKSGRGERSSSEADEAEFTEEVLELSSESSSEADGTDTCSAPASPAPAHGQDDSALNDVTVDGVRTLGRKYEMQCVLGEGSYGLVLKCRVADGSGRHVAIKSFKVEDSHSDAESVRRTSKREVAMLRALQHPNVVGYEAVFYARGRLFIVMEYVPDTLLTLLEEQPEGLEGHAVQPLVRQLCSAMAFIHSKNAIYRDIKPENVLIDQDRTLKLCDFGFARFMNAPGEMLTDYIATRWYRAPELLLGPPFLSGSETVQYMYGPATDMWAIGCLMVEMLTGQPLFPGSSEIDQLHLILQLLGPLIPEHQDLFDRNPHNAGAKYKVDEGAEASLANKLAGKISAVELDFLSGLLCMDPERRLTGAQCLAHPYLAG